MCGGCDFFFLKKTKKKKKKNIDDLVARDRDISPLGRCLGERLYFLADANWNTTAVVE